jgi:hypothetical protein
LLIVLINAGEAIGRKVDYGVHSGPGGAADA